MGKAARAAGATPLRRRRGLPEEIIVWDILVRLPPKSLLRCRAVCREWRRVTSKRRFLLAHHARQPSLPIFLGSDEIFGVHYHNIRAFDHRLDGGDLDTVARLDDAFDLEASCDGLLVLSVFDDADDSRTFSVCNPATREHASLSWPSSDFDVLGMYQHRPTGKYRLLLSVSFESYNDRICCYVFPLGSTDPPRFITWLETKSNCLDVPVLVRDSLHWYSEEYYPSGSKPLQHQSDSKPVVVFDTVAESFRRMRAPVTDDDAHIFDMDGTLGMYMYGCCGTTKARLGTNSTESNCHLQKSGSSL